MIGRQKLSSWSIFTAASRVADPDPILVVRNLDPDLGGENFRSWFKALQLTKISFFSRIIQFLDFRSRSKGPKIQMLNNSDHR